MPKLPKIDLPKVEVPKPVYAGAGVADLAVTAVKDYYETVSKKVTGYRTELTDRVSGYQKSVTGFEPKAFAGDLQGTARALPAKVTSYYKSYYKGTTATATEAYQDLAKRGEVLVAKLRGEAPEPVAKQAPAKKTAAKKAPVAKKAPAKKPIDEA